MDYDKRNRKINNSFNPRLGKIFPQGKWFIDQAERNPVALFLSLTMIILVGLNVFPFIWSFAVSFCSWNLTNRLVDLKFVGIQNYISIFFRDSFFWSSVKVTFIFLVTTITVQLILGLMIALLIYGEQGKLGIVKTIIILPIMITSVVVGLIWRFMFNPELGMINYLLSLIGITGPIWLGHIQTSLLSVMIADIWQWTPFMALVLLAGLEAIPKEPLEAAYVDGASQIQSFFYVILPMLKPAMVVVLLIRTIDAFKTCDLVFVMTMGGPGTSTQVLSLYAYKWGFKFFEMGYAAAVAYIMLFAVDSVALIVLWKTNLRSYLNV